MHWRNWAVKKFFASLMPFDKVQTERFSDKTVNDLVKASFEMGKVKTGALMVIEQNVKLTEYERTGIEVDGLISSQLLINIFEHNTPLHDGAVIIRGNRVVCRNMLSSVIRQHGDQQRAGNQTSCRCRYL